MSANKASEAHAVIVTGAGGGIGAATVELLAARGTNVFAVDINPSALAKLTPDSRATVATRVADISDEAAARACVAEALDRFGRLDGLFNNAAIVGPVQGIDEYPLEEFDRVLRTNVRGVWLCAKYALPPLRATGGGTVVNTASSAGLMGWPRLSGYVCAKHAVVGLTRALAAECAPAGIRVNALCPGPTDTAMLQTIGDNVAPDDRATARRLQERNVPAGRLAHPDEIAAAAVWLLLDAPAYLTGAVLSVDGGQTAAFGLAQTSELST
jgi:NAD(P)-dependent dehydrogenase (short-subunit alcohol dehydrogenase family)